MTSVLATALPPAAIGAYAVAGSSVLVLAARGGWLTPGRWEHGPKRTLPGGVSPFGFLAVFMVVAGAAVGVDTGELVWSRDFATFLTNVGLLLGAAAVLHRLGQHREEPREARAFPGRLRRSLRLGLGGCLVGFTLTRGVLAVASTIASALGAPAMQAVTVRSPGVAEGTLLAVTALVTAPLLEEVVYRGLLQTVLLGLLGRSARVAVILLAAGTFALVHLPGGGWAGVAGLMVLGVVLGVLYERTGSLLPCVVAHAGYNALTLVAASIG